MSHDSGQAGEGGEHVRGDAADVRGELMRDIWDTEATPGRARSTHKQTCGGSGCSGPKSACWSRASYSRSSPASEVVMFKTGLAAVVATAFVLLLTPAAT